MNSTYSNVPSRYMTPELQKYLDAQPANQTALNRVSTPATPAPSTPSTTVDRTSVISPYQQSLIDARNATNTFDSEKAKAEAYTAGIRNARIDAINQMFAPRIQAEQQAAQGRMSRVAALNFNSGITGSGVDTTKLGEQQNLNKGAMDALLAERNNAIQGAYDAADKLSTSMAERAYNRNVKSAEQNVEIQKEKYNTAVTSIQLFGKGGVSLDTLKTKDPQTYQNIKDATGLSDLQIANMINVNSLQPSQVDTRIENGYLVSSYFDPTTKKFVHYSEKLPNDLNTKNIEVVTGKDGQVYAYDKANNKVINTFGNPTTTGDSFTNTQTQKGASNAGVELSVFKNFDKDVQNFMINSSDPERQMISDNLRKVSEGKITSAEFNDLFTKGELSSLNVSPTVKEFFLTQAKNAETKVPPKEPGLLSKLWNTIF